MQVTAMIKVAATARNYYAIGLKCYGYNACITIF